MAENQDPSKHQPQASFVWYELMTTDMKAAESFYAAVVGWGAMPAPGSSEMPYTLLTAAGTPVAGLMNLPAQAQGMPPAWLGYVAVEDVDAKAAQAKALGGAIHVGPQDIPGVGRFATISDPQGAALVLFKSAMPAPDTAIASRTAGHTGWHELMAVDHDKAFAFYSQLFGWAKSTPVDMGPMGIYQLFSINGEDAGGMFNKPAEVPVPFWTFYFIVDAIDAAVERLTSAGGKLITEPMEVPGGAWIVQGIDPQGAMFSLTAPKR